MPKKQAKAKATAAIRYRARVGLTFPADPGIVARLAGGERIPREDRGELRRVAAGEVADDIPAQSIPWLLAAGKIEAVTEADPDDTADEGADT